MKHSILLMIGIAILASSCEHKDYVTPDVETPVFTISGYRNGEPFTLSAGENGLVQTGTIERNKFGVMEWTSSFTNAACPTCEPEFSLTVNDSEGIDLSDCGNLEIFSNNQILFAEEASASEFEECTLSINGIDQIDEASFDIQGSNTLSSTTFFFDTEGIYQASTTFELEDESSWEENEIQIQQTIYAGQHRRLSAPFLYEVLEDKGDEQEIRLYFPEIPALRATHWDINGIVDEQESVTLEFDTNTENRIEIFYVNDVTGDEGSYSLRFNRSFPINEFCDEDHHIMPAPSINVDWTAGEPNYERAFITYRWQGKTFVSTTPFNNGSVLNLLGYEDFNAGLQGNSALQLNTSFSVKLVELGNESNVLELTDCTGSFGFIRPN
jgi:Zn ribbon nucleic-acid-binding protein